MGWILAGSPDAGPIERAQVRVQHLVVFLHVLVGPVYMVVFGWLGLWAAVSVLGVAIVGAVYGLLRYTRSGHADVGGIVVSMGFFLTIATALVARGGMTSNSAAWLLLAPVLAFMMVGPRHGVQIGAVTVLVFAGLWGLEFAGVAMPPGLPPEIAHVMILVDYPIVGGVIAALLWVQAGVWDRVVAQLDAGNRRLRDEVVERERAERSAMDAARARYTFLATMSHEIRTPLNGVLGLTEVLLDTPLDAEQRQLATTVRDSGELLRALLDDVLDFSKIDSGRLEIEAVPINLRQLCEDVLGLWRGPAGDASLQLQVVWTGSAPGWIIGDPTKLRQVLGNLVSNAIKFTDHGYVRIVVQADQALLLEVHDSGIGLDPAASEHIFEPFRQADSTTTRRYGGTGLGLAICRRLAEAMQGTLTVQSTPGEGAVFTLRLPLRLAEAPPEPRPGGAEVAEERRPLAGHLVLVAEDNAVNQVVVRRLLERHGIQVVIADDGEACVQQWQACHPDLILMDCQMPVCDGYDAARKIRAAHGELPIIAVTANTMPGDRARSIEAGMNDHLGKPIRPAELEAILSRWLRERAATKGELQT